LIQRILDSQRYSVTERGMQVALRFTRCHARLFRPVLGELLAQEFPDDAPKRHALDNFDQAGDRYLDRVKVQPAA
jgi:hypothetical protein